MKANKIFIVILVLSLLYSGCNGCKSPTSCIVNINLLCEAEDYDDSGGLIRKEDKSNASQKECVHIGPDSDDKDEGVGSMLSYNFELECNFNMGVFEIRYSDDVEGNIIHVYLDDVKKGCFRTEDTGEWNDFQWSFQKINLGYIDKGSHTIELEITYGGSWGVILDCFKITKVEPSDEVTGANNYIKSLIHDNTGLVKSADYDKNFTTVYKNALAAMVFIHENDLSFAEGIFDFFKSEYSVPFNGFPQSWDPERGNATDENYWVGDNAFLLLALNYYKKETGSFGNYEDMAEGLVNWLCENASDTIIAEGLANMYAALKPFEDSVVCADTILPKIKEWFDANKDYPNVLDHIERGALVFSDISGFDYMDGFKRTEIWEYNGMEVNLLAAFFDDDFVNLEISAQILLAWEIWKSDLAIDLSYLETEIDKVWLLSSSAPDVISYYGLPYFLSYDPTPETGHGWPYCYNAPIIDPVCYMLFYYWGFNPMAPGEKGY
jgi:hypothetical protein